MDGCPCVGITEVGGTGEAELKFGGPRQRQITPDLVRIRRWSSLDVVVAWQSPLGGEKISEDFVTISLAKKRVDADEVVAEDLEAAAAPFFFPCGSA
jgi:hypothetical protein